MTWYWIYLIILAYILFIHITTYFCMNKFEFDVIVSIFMGFFWPITWNGIILTGLFMEIAIMLGFIIDYIKDKIYKGDK